MNPKKGDIVLYVCEFDSDSSYSPNVLPGIVVKVNLDDTLDLVVHGINVEFYKEGVKRDDIKSRQTWHPKE